MPIAYTPSVASKTLDTAVLALGHASDILNDVQPISTQLLAYVRQLDECLISGVKSLDTVKNFLKVLEGLLKIMKLLKFVPTIGTVISQAANVIEKSQVEQTVRKVVQEVEKIIDEAQKGIMQKLRAGLNGLGTKLTQASAHLPNWKNVLNTISALYKLIDMVIYVFFGATSDQMVEAALQGLTKLAEDVKAGFQLIGDAVAPVKQFIADTLELLKNGVLASLKNAFATLIDKLSPVKEVIDSCKSVLDGVEGAFAAIGEALKVFQWVYDHTVGLLVDKLMEALHIDMLFKELSDKISQAVGIADIKQTLQDMFDKTIEPVVGKIERLVNATDLNSIAGSIKNTADLIDGFRKDPAWQLYSLIEQGLLKNPHHCDPDGFCRFWEDDETDSDTHVHSLVQMKMAALTIGPSRTAVNSPAKKRLDGHTSTMSNNKPRAARDLSTALHERQKAMDNVVSSAFVVDVLSSVSVVSPSHNVGSTNMTLFALEASPQPLPPTNPVPTHPATNWIKMDYAIHNDMPVSILLRTTHAAFRASLESRASQMSVLKAAPGAEAIVKESALFNADLQGLPSLAASPKAADAVPPPDPAVAAVKSDLALLRTQVTTCLAALVPLVNLASELEKDFSLLSTSTYEFVDHHLALLQGLDPILSSITGLLALSNKYRSALLGVGDMIPKEWIDWIFNIVTRVENSVTDFGKEKDTVIKVTEGFKIVFQAYHGNFDGAGLGLSDAIYALQQKMQGALEGLSAIDNGVNALVSSPPGEPELQPRIQGLQSAVHYLQTTWSALPTLPSHIGQLSTNLVALHTDLTNFLFTTLTISHHSTTLEKKLIATDLIRLQCERLSSLFGVFETVLAQLGVRADPDQTSPSAAAVEISHGLHPVVQEAGSQFLRDLVQQGIPDLVVGGLEAFLKEYFVMEAFGKELGTVGEELEKKTGAVKGRVAELKESVKLLEGVGKTDEPK